MGLGDGWPDCRICILKPSELRLSSGENSAKACFSGGSGAFLGYPGRAGPPKQAKGSQ
jgi:hypothetical protein